MLTIDGSFGEGGGQVLRSALALAMTSHQAFRIVNIRCRRSPPGLRPQHLAAVHAAARVCGAEVTGAVLGASELSFAPRAVQGGDYDFSIGTAGSTTLVLQTILPALMLADCPSTLRIEGGTHNPQAPTFEFLARAYLPVIERMGPKVNLEMVRPGFYPRGGGCLELQIEPVERLATWQLETRGDLQALVAEIMLSKLPQHIADREASVLRENLRIATESIVVRQPIDSLSPGNAVTVFCVSEQITDVFAAVGQRGVSAEKVAREAVRATQHYLEADVPVGEHLADQLLVPLALAGAGSFVTLPPSRHTLTNIEVIEQVMDVRIGCARIPGTERWRVELG
jgi:RNA 3'-terminal phosphate cyclase (ATP)